MRKEENICIVGIFVGIVNNSKIAAVSNLVLLAYYSGRAENGQVVEKGDSSFIQNPGDRLAARRTILRYPVSVLAKKRFVVYDKEHDTVSVNSLLANDRQHINAAYVRSRCKELLDKYYYTAE